LLILGSLEPEETPKAGVALAVAESLAAFPADRGHRIIKRGVSSRLLEPLACYLELGKGELAEVLDLDRTTVQRKTSRDAVLPMHAAESMLRLIDLRRMAEDTFETTADADAWLRRPHPLLDGETPLACAKSAYGALRVKDVLVAIKYGGVA